MAVFRKKIEGAAKVVAPLSQRSESARIAFVAARSALVSTQAIRRHLSSRRFSEMIAACDVGRAAPGQVDAESAAAVFDDAQRCVRADIAGRRDPGAAATYRSKNTRALRHNDFQATFLSSTIATCIDSGELLSECLHWLLLWLQVAGRALVAATARYESAEFEYLEAKDELEDAVQRKRLLVQQLQLIMEGSAGSEGRLAVSCALSLRTGGQVAAVLDGLDGAAVVLRLGGTACKNTNELPKAVWL
jgi:hypothetical protein